LGLEQSIFTRLVAKNNAASPRVDEDKSDEPNEASIGIKLPCGHGSFPLPRALLQNPFMNFKLFQTSRKRRLHLFFSRSLSSPLLLSVFLHLLLMKCYKSFEGKAIERANFFRLG
jgi:hypothetical protein